jgi:hypothetical protein
VELIDVVDELVDEAVLLVEDVVDADVLATVVI